MCDTDLPPLFKMAAPMFEIVYTVTADGNVPITKYRSKKTGLTVFIAQVEGPLVNGYFCLGKIMTQVKKNLGDNVWRIRPKYVRT